MRRRKTLMILAATALVATAAPALALAQDRVTQQAKDPVTGALVRLYETKTGPRVVVETPAVTLRKELSGGTVITTLTGGRESLVIEADGSTLTVTGTRGHVVVSGEDRAGLERAKRLVAQSPLSTRAAALIARMGFGDAAALQPLLLTTRAFLLAAADDESGTLELKAWVRKARMRTQVINTGGGQKTPSECWKEYGNEVLAAYDDFLDCINHIKWWDPLFPIQRCEVVYEVRIIGAFAWYADCVKLLGLIGG